MIYHVPTNVALTMAIFAGGGGAGGGIPVVPIGAAAFDEPVNRIPTTIAAGGSLTVSLTAIGAGKSGAVTMIGVSTSDAANTRLTTRINGVAVAPLILVIGALGTLQAPAVLAVPILIPSLGVFSLLMENISVGNIDMAARLVGWRVP